ncbi:MAG: hypothetical protein K2X57_09285 [Xanthobacteraceae bacterium]|nr:hypothetical protein [Xanthobacteraceae bacterium]
MQRQSFLRLYAWVISLHRASRSRRSAQATMIETSASPILIFAAIALFLVLAILEIDLHRDELRELGLIVGEESLAPSLVGP